MADNIDVTAGAGKTVAADEIGAVLFQRVKLIHGADGINNGDVSSANGLPVSVAGSSATIGVKLDAINQTIMARVQQIDGTVAVYFSPSEPTIKGVTNSVGVYIDTIRQTAGVRVGQVDGTVAVYFSPAEPTIKGITNSVGVYVDSIRQTAGVRVGQVDGTVAVYFDKSNPKVNLGNDVLNTSATAVVGSAGGSVSGQYVGISDLGVTLVAPEANHNTKIYAFSIITTAQVQIVPKFTNGAGAATELWRVALQAPTQGISGVSQSIQPPGYLFATGVNTTLALRLDSASLVHYSISYFKESA